MTHFLRLQSLEYILDSIFYLLEVNQSIQARAEAALILHIVDHFSTVSNPLFKNPGMLLERIDAVIVSESVADVRLEEVALIPIL